MSDAPLFPPHPDSIDALLDLRGWQYFQESKLGNDLFISDPDRASRIYDAAEDGCDGSTHAEVIEDWREFADLLRDECSRFAWNLDDENAAATFEATFEGAFDRLTRDIDACEAWHDANGSLYEEIG